MNRRGFFATSLGAAIATKLGLDPQLFEWESGPVKPHAYHLASDTGHRVRVKQIWENYPDGTSTLIYDHRDRP